MAVLAPTELHQRSPDMVRARVDLVLGNLLVDGQRVLSMLRTRRYRLERFELEAPARCHLWLRIRATDVWLLEARLERLCGVTVEGGARWSRPG